MSVLEPNEADIRATWRWLAHSEHGVSEVRVIRPGGGMAGIGFFDDEEAFVRECARTNAAGNVYVGIQPRPRRLLEQAPNAIRPLRSGGTKRDVEILTGTVIDIDPVRPKDTASTEAELALAIEAAAEAVAWCEAEGLLRPLLMMSGNGAQLWFALRPTSLAGRAERLQAGLKRFEAEIRAQIASEAVHVDSIHDVARVIKVIGTVSRKGDGAGERPHRLSRPLEGFERREDAGLLARFDTAEELSPRPRASRLPVLQESPEGKAKRTADGRYDWAHPVEMCGPVQRLWDHGAEDRSAAIFDMVRFFAHKGLPIAEITELVLEYDRRGLGKLRARDGPEYIRKAYEKVQATRRDDGTIAPPCHALQRLDFCRVNREPGARCDLYDVVFDIEKAIDALPAGVPPTEIEYRLRPILDAIAHRDRESQSKFLDRLEARFGLAPDDLRSAMARVESREEDAPERSEDAIDGEIYEDARYYYTLTTRGEPRVVSSFTIAPTMRVATDDGELIVGDALTDKGATVSGLRLPLSAFHSKRDLIRHLPSADLQWTGSDNNVQGLLRVLARRPVPTRRGSHTLGFQEFGGQRLWLGPEIAIGSQGVLEPSPIVYVSTGASLEKRLTYLPTDDETFQSIARVIFRCLPEVNRPEVILPVLGWFFATPMKPVIMKAIGSFPSLFVWGTQGSGKSSLMSDIMWPLFGVRDGEPYSATETEFALLKLLTSTRSVPIFIDEYKPFDMPKQRLNTLHRYLRRLYRGETEERGRPDLKVTSYHLQAPVCVAGETRPTEAALLERIITANPEKTTLAERPSCQLAHRELRAADLILFAPRYIQFCLGRHVGADLEVARSVTRALLGDRLVPVRVAENLTVMLLGIHLFEEFAKACGCELPGDLGAKEAVDAVLADVLETDHGVKNAFDHFLEMLSVMAVQGELKHRVHYVFDDGRLAIHLESAYDAFRAHCKRIDYDGELVDLKALRRLIAENKKLGGYVIAESERVVFEGGRRRAVIVDVARAQGVGAEDFPAGAESGADQTGYFKSWYRREGAS